MGTTSIWTSVATWCEIRHTFCSFVLFVPLFMVCPPVCVFRSCLSSYWETEPPGHWATGTLGHWNTWTLVNQDTGIMGEVGGPTYCNRGVSFEKLRPPGFSKVRNWNWDIFLLFFTPPPYLGPFLNFFVFFCDGSPKGGWEISGQQDKIFTDMVLFGGQRPPQYR